MSDDVDDLLRGAMASLDRQAPEGYFDTLEARTLARLDGDVLDDFVAEEEVTDAEVIGEREEHSGLQDIRALASETKARLARRTSQEIAREDLLASSSAGWKAVALPDPGRASAAASASTAAPPDELAQQRAARAAAQLATTGAAAASAPANAPQASAAPAVAPTARRRRMLATVGLGVAAAAGAVIFVSVRGNEAAAPVSPVRRDDAARAPVAASQPGAAAPPAAAPAPVVATPATPAPVATAAASPAKPITKGGRGKTIKPDAVGPSSKKAASPHDPADSAPGAAAGSGSAVPSAKPTNAAPPRAGSDEPSFDELVQQAGITPAKPAAPKLDRQALSADDIKRGMTAITARAKACYTGTEGLASVKLTVAPSGHVTRVTTSGPFAGTPTAACVERAVKTATFPPWDGGPQSFGYSYLLSE